MHKRLVIGLLLIAGVCFAGAGPDAAQAGGESCDNRTNNTAAKLMECVTLDGVREHQAALQAFADANGGNRASGTPGYDQSADYVAGVLEAAGYNVTMQEFEFHRFAQLGPSALEQVSPAAITYAENLDYRVMGESDPGDVTADVTAVDLHLGLGNTSTSGCEAADFAGFPAGNIALIQRGTCTFQVKAENAAAAGAAGAIIFNQGNTSDPSRLDANSGTLSPEYAGGIPVVSATYALGAELSLTPGLVMRIEVDTFRGQATSYNVIAETPGGNADNIVMLGAHLDSVDEGPGINANGSGSAALLEVAEQFAKVKPVNKVRFAWWGAGESGLAGSTHYVTGLSPAEQEDIALYLNFDAIGSPNYVLFVYDGDDSDGVGQGAGPDGSAAIEALFQEFYSSVGEQSRGTDFTGGSDYSPFIAAGIPSGGLFTGAEGIKTAEEQAIWGGTAGVQYDPCYHLPCDTFANVSNHALDVNADAIAYALAHYARSTQTGNSVP